MPHLLLLSCLILACEAPTPPAPVEQPGAHTQTASPTAETEKAVEPQPPRPPDTPTPKIKRRVHEVHAHLNPDAVPVVLDIFDDEGIDRVVNLSGGHPQSSLNQHLALAEHTRGRVVPFFNIAWKRLPIEGENFGDAIAKDFRDALEAGAGGLKISKALGLGVPSLDGETLLTVDDPLLDPIFKVAAEFGVPVSIHTSDPKAFFEPPTPDNERYKELSLNPSWSFYGDEFPSRESLLEARERLVAKHPDTTFILVHFANNPEDIDFVDRLLDAHPNAYVDISARLSEIGRHDPERVRALFIKHRKRILFGTDFMLTIKGQRGRLTLGSTSEKPLTIKDIHPFFDLHWRYLEGNEASIPNPVPIQGDWDIRPIHLPPDVLEDIYTGNAERLIFKPYDARHPWDGADSKAPAP